MINKKKSMIVLLSTLFWLILTVKTSYAQGLCDVYHFRLHQVRGKVVAADLYGGKPIPDAKIELREITRDLKVIVLKTVFVDKDGYFDLGDVRKGEYQLAVSQNELDFIDFFIGVTVKKQNRAKKKEKIIYVRLGMAVVKPCGGGNAILVDS